MKMLLTGGHGFIGSALVPRLLAAGHELRCLVRERSDTRRIDGLPWERAVGDVRDRASVEAALAGCEGLFHLAAVSAWPEHRSPHLAPTIDEGTRIVLEAAEALGLRRVVHVSSAAAIGASTRPELRHEASPYDAAGRHLKYAEAKRAAEAHARAVATRGRLDVVIVNPTETYGPGDDALVTAGNLLTALKDPVALGCPGGTSVVHVDDVARGLVAAFERGRSGERYILGGDNVSVPELLRLTLRLAGQSKPVVIAPGGLLRGVVWALDRLGLPTPVVPEVLDYATLYWFVDNRRAREELGVSFRPAAEVVADTLRWLVRAGHLAPAEAPALA